MTIEYRSRLGLKRQALKVAQLTTYYCGAASLYARMAKNFPITILMYHSVCRSSDECWIAPRNRVSENEFEQQISYLALHRNVISLDELIDCLEKHRKMPKNTVLLTFDDGYRDTLEVAAPILEKYKMPATVYLATGYVDRGENQWEDQLYSYHRHAMNLPDDAEVRYRAIKRALVSLPPKERRDILQAERAQLRPVKLPVRTTLVWDEVKELDRSYRNITLGVHTHEHIDLTTLSADLAVEEIKRSVDRFRDELEYFPKHFSFPYCRVNGEVRGRLAELGLRSAMTEIGVVYPSKSTPLDLKRLESCGNLSTIRYLTSGAHPGLSIRLFGRA